MAKRCASFHRRKGGADRPVESVKVNFWTLSVRNDPSAVTFDLQNVRTLGSNETPGIRQSGGTPKVNGFMGRGEEERGR